MEIICPVSDRMMNANAARAVAILVAILGSVSLISDIRIVGPILIIDFLSRGCLHGKLSCLGIISKYAVDLLHIKELPINAEPKIFAARLGLLMSSAATVLAYSGLIIAAQITMGMLIMAASLEGLFGLCLGCRIYTILHRINPNW